MRHAAWFIVVVLSLLWVSVKTLFE